MDKEPIDLAAKILLIIGGLNWALYGLMQIDLVDMLVGTVPILAQAVYGIIGLSALWVGYKEFMG